MFRFKRLRWLLLLVLLAGCSTTHLAYDHLDTLLRWDLSDYVDLSPAQRQSFDRELQPVWRWHRSTQLPLYAAELRGLAGRVQAGAVPEEPLDAAAERLRAEFDQLLQQARPGAARLLQTLSDAQAADAVARIGKQIDRREHKRLGQTEAELRKHLRQDMEERLHTWIGRPSAQQRRLVEQWAAQVRLEPQARAQEQRAALQRFAALLATRTQPGFEARLRDYLEAPLSAAAEQAQATERKRWLQLLSALSATLDADQREHLRQRLLGFAEDFETLAAESPAAE